MPHVLPVANLICMCSNGLPFFVLMNREDEPFTKAMLSQAGCVTLRSAGSLQSREGGMIMMVWWGAHSSVAIFFVYCSELRFGTLFVPAIQRAWRRSRAQRQRVAIAMVEERTLLARVLRTLCWEDLARMVR